MNIGIVVSEFNYRDHLNNHEILELCWSRPSQPSVAAGEPQILEVR